MEVSICNKKRKVESSSSESCDSKEELEKRSKKKHSITKSTNEKHKRKTKKSTREKDEDNEQIGPALPDAFTCKEQEQGSSKAMIPMTKDEWEKRQSLVRRVYDPKTGRNRLVKGDGEILEDIVSYSRHKEINKQATKSDSECFQQKMGLGRIQ